MTKNVHKTLSGGGGSSGGGGVRGLELVVSEWGSQNLVLQAEIG